MFESVEMTRSWRSSSQRPLPSSCPFLITCCRNSRGVRCALQVDANKANIGWRVNHTVRLDRLRWLQYCNYRKAVGLTLVAYIKTRLSRCSLLDVGAFPRRVTCEWVHDTIHIPGFCLKLGIIPRGPIPCFHGRFYLSHHNRWQSKPNRSVIIH